LEFYTHQDIQYQLADKIAVIRKQKKLTQKQMAKKSDIPLSTYARIEQLGEGSLKDFSKILIALDRADEISKILIVSEQTPIEVYEKMKAKQ
jgi:transcriptional regulator with XRE-family HTH domain